MTSDQRREEDEHRRINNITGANGSDSDGLASLGSEIGFTSSEQREQGDHPQVCAQTKSVPRQNLRW